MRKYKIAKIIIGILVTISFAHFCAYATNQLKDEIIYKGKTYTIEEYPFNQYYNEESVRSIKLLHPAALTFDVESTANYKGYTAKWEIRNEQLYLIVFQAKRNGKDVQISEIFHNQTKFPVKADWYTGEITINLEESQFLYGEFLSPTILILKIKNGKVVGKTKTKNNKLLTNKSNGPSRGSNKPLPGR